MANLSLTVACGPYDRTQALWEGQVKPEGIDLTYIPIQSPPEIFTRMIDMGSFDASEMSLSTYLQLRAQGNDEFIAIPIFPSRVFRHGFIFVRDHIQSPADIAGKTVGVPEYWQTAAVWIRGLLQNEYQIDLQTVNWIEGGVDVPLSSEEHHARQDALGFRPKILPQGENLSDSLAKGTIDAVIGARKPNSVNRDPKVVRLFPNYREIEREYYERTKIFPIMHTFVLRNSIYERHPWVAESLFKAFSQSKKICLDKMRFTGTIKYTLPWLFSDLEEIDTLFEGDPWPYGFVANQHVLETFSHYLTQQNFIDKELDLVKQFTTILDSTQ